MRRDKLRILLSALFFVLFLSGAATAEDLNPTYKESIPLSRQHADSPAGWVPDYPTSGSRQIVTIQGDPDKENAHFGLTYDTKGYGDGKNYLIVRTLSKTDYMGSNYVNQPGYKVFGKATESAYWVTTGNEATKFLRDNGGTSANIVKLMERALGMNNDGSHTAMVEYAVIADNDHILRPTKISDIKTYATDPTKYGTNASYGEKPSDMAQVTYDNYVGTATQTGYYEYWKKKTYDSDAGSNDAFPWTQIGYTFLWGNGQEKLADIQGLSEFILLGGTSLQIYGLYSPQSYIYTLNKDGAFSTAADAQYGNGFASFKVDGTCDSLWAGHRFQRNVSTGTANQINITNTGSISGGQGLLIWSLNYAVNNQGTISGATANKFATMNTGNIAVLFKGDTTAYGDIPAPAGSNTLTNSGTISSPGTAVMAEAGDTNITNKSGGLLTGDTVAIQIGQANAAPTVKGIIDNTGTISSSGTAIKADRGDNTIVNNSGGIISGGAYAIQTGAGNDTVTVKGGEIAGKVDLGTGTDKFDVTGADGAAKLSFTIDRDTAASAQVLVKDGGNGTVSIADNTKLAVTVGGAKNIQNNDRFLIADAGGTLTVTPANLVIQNDGSLPMVGFSALKDANKLYLLAARNGSYYGGNSGNTSLGNLLDSLANTATGDMANVLGNLDKSGDAGNALKLQPNVDGGTMQASFGAMNKYTGAVVNRIEQVMTGRAAGEGMTGIATGDESARNGAWAQGLGSYLHQDPQGTVNGYSVDIWGVAFGFDRYFFPSLMLGLSGGYARNKITTADPNTGADADSYQAGLYGNLAREAYYLDGVFSFAYNKYNASRHIAFGTTNRIAKSNYNGQQYSGYLEGGYAFGVNGFTITPLASVQYMHLQLGDYTETEAGDLNLHVDSQGYNMLQVGVGAKLSYQLTSRDVRIIPELHGKFLYDFIGDQQQATATFTGGGAAFATKGFDPPRASGNLGVKLTLMTKNNLSFALNYDYEWKAGYYSHNGYFHIRYAF